MNDEVLERSLLENALDFVDRAVDELRGQQGELERENKYAALFLASGIEVLVKARLVREHWSLVFEDPASASLARFRSGDFVSVQASKVIQRLNNIAGLNVEVEQAHKVFGLRNRLVHFAPSPHGNAARTVLAGGLSFVATFLEEHLKEHLLEEELRIVEAAQEKINVMYVDLKDFADKRMYMLEGTLNTKPLIIACPECSQLALEPGSDVETSPPRCHFCYYTASGADVARDYASWILFSSAYDAIKGGGEYPIHICLECSAESLIEGVAVRNRPNLTFACLTCSAHYEQHDLGRCVRCGTLTMPDEDGWSMCYNCL